VVNSSRAGRDPPDTYSCLHRCAARNANLYSLRVCATVDPRSAGQRRWRAGLGFCRDIKRSALAGSPRQRSGECSDKGPLRRPISAQATLLCEPRQLPFVDPASPVSARKHGTRSHPQFACVHGAGCSRVEWRTSAGPVARHVNRSKPCLYSDRRGAGSPSRTPARWGAFAEVTCRATRHAGCLIPKHPTPNFTGLGSWELDVGS
jgi:hypothetical protein